MIIYAVHVFVVAGKEEEFIEASKKNRKETRNEAGNLRFDILQMTEDSSQFLLYEIYQSEDAVKAHKNTAHYLAWRKAVTPLMAKPREGVKYRQLSEFE